MYCLSCGIEYLAGHGLLPLVFCAIELEPRDQSHDVLKLAKFTREMWLKI